MPGMSGLDVVREIGPERSPFIVFITAYDQFALRAFDVNALDYVLKPFTDARLRTALERARQAIENREYRDLGQRLLHLVSAGPAASAASATDTAAARLRTHFIVQTRERALRIPAADVDWIEAADYYIRLHVGDATHLVRETLSALESQLDPAHFLRVHRSAIVNVDRVAELFDAPGGRYALRLRNGQRIRVARSHWHELRRQANRGG